MRPWWKRWQGRLEYELAELEDAGFPYELDEQAKAAGIIKIAVTAPVDGQPRKFIAIYPDLYPYFRFEIHTVDLRLPRHQHARSGTLCLFGRRTENWSSDDTLATVLTNRLPNLLKAALGGDAEEVARLEEHQGEPASDYYPYEENLIVLIDSEWALDPGAGHGELTLGSRLGFDKRDRPRFRGVVTEVRAADGRVLASAEPSLSDLSSGTIRGRWVRAKEALPPFNADEFFDVLARVDSRLRQPLWQTGGGARIDVIGVVFPEEGGWRRQNDGWVFVIRIAKPGTNGRKWKTYFARAGRAGRTDMVGRIPELAPLHSKTVANIGLGALGAPSALEFARAGVGRLRLLDSDFVDPATVVRWPLGLAAAGFNKTETLIEFLAEHYPYTEVTGMRHRLGGVRNLDDPTPSDLEVVESLAHDADLIYDATAELGVQRFLSEIARERKIPYICVSATEGVWGGLLARIRPHETEGCWLCLQHALEDKAIPVPPRDPEGAVQPTSCADPTFTGAGFDLVEIALGGVRLAVSTLAAEMAGGYPSFSWDVARIVLRETRETLIAPRWETFSLKRHVACEECGSRAA